MALAENIQLVADLKIGKVDASALAAALNTEISKTTGALGGGAKKAGGKGKAGAGGGDIALAIQAVLGDIFDDFISVLQSIVKVLLTILGAVVILKVIADILGAFWSAFQPLTKVWTGILSAITKMVEPFANLLIPLLLPFLQISTNVARILNVMLLPLFTLMMKAFSGLGGTAAKATTQIFEGDIGGGINTMLEGMGEAFSEVETELRDTLLPILKMMASWISGFLEMDVEEIKTTLQDKLGTELGGAAGNLIEFMQSALSAITGFIASVLVGKGTFDDVFGEGEFDNLTKTNEGFKWGVDAGETLKQIWTWLVDFFGKISSVALGIIFVTLATLLDKVLIPAFDIIGTWLDENKNTIVTNLKNMMFWGGKMGDAAFSLQAEIFNFLKDIWPNLETSLQSLSDSAQDLADLMNSVTKLDLSGQGTGLNLGTAAAFLTGGAQGVVRRESETQLINYITIQGNGDKFLEDKVKEGVESAFAAWSRLGYFQLGR